MIDERIKDLIILYDDSIRYQKKLLDYKIAEELLCVIPTCTKNKNTLETQLGEKANECEGLKLCLETAKDNVAKLYAKYKEKTQIKEFLDFGIFSSTFRDSNEETDTTSNLKDNDFLRQYDISLDDYLAAEIMNDEKHEHLPPSQEFHGGDHLVDDSKSIIEGIQIVDVKTIITTDRTPISGESSMTDDKTTLLQDSNEFMGNTKSLKEEPRSTMIIPDQQNPSECSTCDVNYNTRSKNSTNLTVDTLKMKKTREIAYQIDKVKNERCKICGRRYASKSSLKQHISKIHVTEKSYESATCGKVFKNQESKFQHRQIVHTEASFECADCGKRCSRKQNLITHIRMKHSMEKLFRCYFCEKSFVLKTSLITHNLIHVPDLPLKCDMCDERFKYHYAKKLHERKVHQKYVVCFPCRNCGTEYSNEKNLLRHQQRKHAGIIQWHDQC